MIKLKLVSKPLYNTKRVINILGKNTWSDFGKFPRNLRLFFKYRKIQKLEILNEKVWFLR